MQEITQHTSSHQRSTPAVEQMQVEQPSQQPISPSQQNYRSLQNRQQLEALDENQRQDFTNVVQYQGMIPVAADYVEQDANEPNSPARSQYSTSGELTCAICLSTVQEDPCKAWAELPSCHHSFHLQCLLGVARVSNEGIIEGYEGGTLYPPER